VRPTSTNAITSAFDRLCTSRSWIDPTDTEEVTGSSATRRPAGKRSGLRGLQLIPRYAEPSRSVLSLDAPSGRDDDHLVAVVANHVTSQLSGNRHLGIWTEVASEDRDLVDERPWPSVGVDEPNPDPPRPLDVDPLNRFAPQRPSVLHMLMMTDA
jgi:hypothetical protein